MTAWERDKQQTDPYLPMVKAICGLYLLGDAPVEEDRERNTDLLVLTARGVRIAVRLRRPEAWKGGTPRQPWCQEFTIRDARPQGTKTEWAKMQDGWGDYFFYGFQAPTSPHLLCKRLL